MQVQKLNIHQMTEWFQFDINKYVLYALNISLYVNKSICCVLLITIYTERKLSALKIWPKEICQQTNSKAHFKESLKRRRRSLRFDLKEAQKI